MNSEKIVILFPIAYIKVFDDYQDDHTIYTKYGVFEARKLFWRIYWVRKAQ